MADTELSNSVADEGVVTSNDAPVESTPVQVEQVETAEARDSAAPTESAQETRGTNDAGSDEKPDRAFDLLTSELPEDETFSLDGFYKGIKPEHLEKLDPLSKQVIHNLRRDYHNKRQSESAKARESAGVLEQKAQALANRERELVTRQKAFAALMQDPKLKEVLAQPESELPDLLSPEGIEARIKRAAAQQLQDLVKPIAEHSERENRKMILNDFMSSNPEMKDAGFRKEVASLIRDRRASGFALSTPDAFELVKAQRAQDEQKRIQSRQRQVRAASARQIGKSKANASKTQGPPKGARAQEIYAWVKANPEEAKRLRLK